MNPHRLYIQQTFFNGVSYTKDTPKDTLAQWGVICADFPFVTHPETKELVTKDWKGSDGLDAYVPKHLRLKDYDIEAKFLYVGTHNNMKNDIKSFCDFIIGKPEGSYSARLVIYDEHTSTGRKDVVVKTVKFDTYWDEPAFDTDAIAAFSITFHVYDPATEITPVYNNNAITDLRWT